MKKLENVTGAATECCFWRAMQRAINFLRTTLLGGVIVVLPAWLAVLLGLKALTHLEIFVKPVSSHLPHSIAHPRVIGILVLIGLCFLVGAAIQTAIGQKAERAAEGAVLEKIPGYTVLRSLASRLSEHGETASFQPALVEMEEALVPAFIVERHSRDRCTVFIPSSSIRRWFEGREGRLRKRGKEED